MKTIGLCDNSPCGDDYGFTRIDLLAIIGVLILFGFVLVSSQAATGRKAGMMECKNNLRQVGVAIDQYTRDHTNSLPGPLWTAAYYNYSIGSWASNHMATFLATYLGLPAPDSTIRDARALQCPANMETCKVRAYYDFNPTSLVMPVYFLLPSTISNAPGNTFSWPFGRPNFAAPAKIQQIRRPSEQWALQDIDRLNNPNVGSTYFQFLPYIPVHTARPGGNRQTFYRNNLYFDWSVRPQLMTN